eukprot:824921-Pyramimonas_sp.AAC.1
MGAEAAREPGTAITMADTLVGLEGWDGRGIDFNAQPPVASDDDLRRMAAAHGPNYRIHRCAQVLYARANKILHMTTCGCIAVDPQSVIDVSTVAPWGDELGASLLEAAGHEVLRTPLSEEHAEALDADTASGL